MPKRPPPRALDNTVDKIVSTAPPDGQGSPTRIETDHHPMHGVRVGEASLPGPERGVLREYPPQGPVALRVAGPFRLFGRPLPRLVRSGLLNEISMQTDVGAGALLSSPDSSTGSEWSNAGGGAPGGLCKGTVIVRWSV